MPYALIPDGYSLKKVTKAQERAVNNKRRHDNVQTILENPRTVPVVASAVGLIVAGTLLDRFIDNLNIDVDKSEFEKAKQATISAAFAITPVNIISSVYTGELGLKLAKLLVPQAGISDEQRNELEQQIRGLLG